MNPVVQAQLKAFSQTNSSVEMSETEFFEVFSIYSILNGIYSESIDPFAAHLKGDEFGLDGLAILIQGVLCQTSDDVASALAHGKRQTVEFALFQSKTSEKLDYGEMAKFFDATYHFFTDSFHAPSDQIRDLSDAMRAVYQASLKENPSLRLFFVSTGSAEPSTQINKLIEATQARLDALNIFSSIEIRTIGAKFIQEGYRSATNSISQSIEIIKPITLPEHPSVQQAFLGYVSAQQLLKLAVVTSPETGQPRVNKAVFFDNIRDFNENSEINQSILSDLSNGDSSSFIFKNNGVTVVAKEVRRTGDEFILDDYQIINGCQTCNILFSAGTDRITGVKVPFRLIESQDSDFIATVIVGTNKQNQVKEDQFWALKPFMKDLEEYARQQPAELQLFLERREFQYRQESIERTRIIKPSDLVKAIAALFLFQPHRAARDYRGIRDEYSNRIFQEGHLVVPYYVAAIASYKIDFLIRNRRVRREWGIYKYYILSMIGYGSTNGEEIFRVKRSHQESICREVIRLLTDEEKLIERYSKGAEILDSMVIEAKLEQRERVRDYIRSESFAESFRVKTSGTKP